MAEKDLTIQDLRRENEWLKKRIELAERKLAEAEKDNDRLTKRAELAESSLYLAVERIPKWIKTADKLPEPFVSVLGHMTDAGDFPSVRECYTLGGTNFFFPAIDDVHPVDMWAAMPTPEEAMGNG